MHFFSRLPSAVLLLSYNCNACSVRLSDFVEFVEFVCRCLIAYSFEIDHHEQLSANLSREYSESCSFSPAVGAVNLTCSRGTYAAKYHSGTYESLAIVDCDINADCTAQATINTACQQPRSRLYACWKSEHQAFNCKTGQVGYQLGTTYVDGTLCNLRHPSSARASLVLC